MHGKTDGWTKKFVEAASRRLIAKHEKYRSKAETFFLFSNKKLWISIIILQKYKYKIFLPIKHIQPIPGLCN